MSATLVNADPPDSFLFREGVMFVFLGAAAEIANRSSDKNLITVDLGEINAHPPMLWVTGSGFQL